MNETETNLLRCTSCGTITSKVVASRHTVRSLSLGREVHTGDLLCPRCLQELQEEIDEEEATRGPR